MSFLRIKPMRKRTVLRFRNGSTLVGLPGGTPIWDLYANCWDQPASEPEYTHKAAVAEVERMYPGEPVTRIQRFKDGDLLIYTAKHTVTFHSTRKKVKQ